MRIIRGTRRSHVDDDDDRDSEHRRLFKAGIHASPAPGARASCVCGDPTWNDARRRFREIAARDASGETSLAPSAVGRPHRFSQATLERVLRAAVALHAGDSGGGPCVWRDAGDEVMVTPARARIATRDGLVFVGLPVFCEENGEAEVTVVFACNHADAPLGAVLATEGAPRGPRAIVERWADALVACAYGALLESLSALVRGAPGEALLLAGLGADAEGLVVVMQRDHDAQSTKNAPLHA